MTLTTTVDGDEIEFCFNAYAPNSEDDAFSVFGAMWTDGVEMSATEENQLDTMGIMCADPGTGEYGCGAIDGFLPEETETD